MSKSLIRGVMFFHTYSTAQVLLNPTTKKFILQRTLSRIILLCSMFLSLTSGGFKPMRHMDIPFTCPSLEKSTGLSYPPDLVQKLRM